MQLEFHPLDRRWEHLRVRQPRLQRRLLASLAESGQQTPIVVVAVEGQPSRYLVIDGHKRIAALQQLGRDTVQATVWPMSDAEALLLDRSLRLSAQESALEQGWLLSEMEQRFGYSLDELARRFEPQCQLGIAALGAGGVTAGSYPAASTPGSDHSASGDEVSGAHGASQWG
jgi:ParB family chromosome partitioning protein